MSANSAVYLTPREGSQLRILRKEKPISQVHQLNSLGSAGPSPSPALLLGTLLLAGLGCPRSILPASEHPFLRYLTFHLHFLRSLDTGLGHPGVRHCNSEFGNN